MPQLHGKQIKASSIENVKLNRPGIRVRVASTVDVPTLAPSPAAIDGVTLATGDRILLKDQTTPTSEDGVYRHDGTNLVRADDFLAGAGVAGILVTSSEGTANADTVWLCTNNGGTDVVGTDDLAFTDVTGTGAFTGGDGIDITGSVIKVDLSATSGLKFTTGTLEIEPESAPAANVQPINLTVTGVGLDIGAIFGVGIEADGAANLRLAAQGNGIAGGAGSVLSVNADGDTITVGAGGVKSVAPTTGDKGVAIVTPTTGDDSDTGVDLTATPVGSRYIQVFVNGLKVDLGGGVTSKDCYFSSNGLPGGVRAFSAIIATDDFMWNGVIAGYELATTDVVDFDHDVAA